MLESKLALRNMIPYESYSARRDAHMANAISCRDCLELASACRIDIIEPISAKHI